MAHLGVVLHVRIVPGKNFLWKVVDSDVWDRSFSCRDVARSNRKRNRHRNWNQSCRAPTAAGTLTNNGSYVQGTAAVASLGSVSGSGSLSISGTATADALTQNGLTIDNGGKFTVNSGAGVAVLSGLTIGMGTLDLKSNEIYSGTFCRIHDPSSVGQRLRFRSMGRPGNQLLGNR